MSATEKRAIVTGGMSGLGEACAARLRELGVNVVTLDLAPGADYVVDVSNSAQVNEAIAAIGPVDILINSAGIIGPNKPLWEIADDEWRKTFGVNSTGIFNLCRAVVPGMVGKGWGRIVNMASIAGKEGNPNLSAYSASKAAVIGLTKALGKELATTGVLVNAIAPAVIETPMNATNTPEVLEYMVSRIPMGRLGQADEVAALVCWLASEECTFSTGAVFDISGGRATY
jgi:NAD(P)-dependent dehydrogenase (short-subunit alcohol dehydrogenase family)